LTKEVTDSEGKTSVIAQSNSIVRFVANRLGLAGRNDIERAHSDMIMEQIRDVFDSLIGVYILKEDNPDKKIRLEKIIAETAPDRFKAIQNILEANKDGNGFLVGNQVSCADLALINVYDWLRERKGEVLAKLPALQQHEAKIRSLPQLTEYLKKNDSVRLTILFEN
jgi:glutathione S-transferase